MAKPIFRQIASRDADSEDLPKPTSARMVLAQRAITGNVQAIRQLLEQVAPRLARVVSMVLRSGHADTDDVIQESLIALVQALPSFRGECEPEQYASRIAVRTAVAAKKRSRKSDERRDASVDADSLFSSQPSPFEATQSEQRKRLIRDLLGELSEEQAETVALRFMMGWSLDEIAEATQVPVNTVRSRLRLAKEALRDRLDAFPNVVDDLEIAQ